METLTNLLIVLSLSTFCLVPLWLTAAIAFFVADLSVSEAPTWIKNAVRVRQ